jgi:L,D-transpeptidase ErfK/SrfK
VGGETTYTMRKGDCLLLVGARVGLNWKKIAELNNVTPENQCKAGVTLTFNNRKIVPKTTDNGIIVNIPGRMLYFFKGGKLITHFPVGLGSKDSPTPTGSFVIIGKQKDPTWYVPKSIQQEMEEKNQEVKTVVLPGPKNPLGKRAIHTSLPHILIHETIWPASVYRWRSHGCIRCSPRTWKPGSSMTWRRA